MSKASCVTLIRQAAAPKPRWRTWPWYGTDIIRFSAISLTAFICTGDEIEILAPGSLEINKNTVKFTNGGSSIVIDGTGVNISAGASKISIKSRGVMLDNVKVDGQKIAH